MYEENSEGQTGDTRDTKKESGPEVEAYNKGSDSNIQEEKSSTELNHNNDNKKPVSDQIEHNRYRHKETSHKNNVTHAKEHHHINHGKHHHSPREVRPYGHRKSLKKAIYEIYDKQYKKLLIIPFLLLFFAIIQIGYQMYSTSYYDAAGSLHIGDFVDKAVSLKGGTSITLDGDEISIETIDLKSLERSLSSELPGVDINVREQSEFGERTGILIEATVELNDDIEIFKRLLEKNIPGLTKDMIEQNIGSVGSTLGQAFFAQTFRALIIAFILMGVIVFIYFRVFVPCVAVILAAFSDIIVTLAIINILGFKLSTAGIAAFLMLIGYSVDTDILLSTRILKRKEGTVLDRTLGALSTGLTMNLTTLAAITVAILFAQSSDLKQIMAILFIGLLVDIINTWIQNAGLLRWYMEKRPLHGKI